MVGPSSGSAATHAALGNSPALLPLGTQAAANTVHRTVRACIPKNGNGLLFLSLSPDGCLYFFLPFVHYFCGLCGSVWGRNFLTIWAELSTGKSSAEAKHILVFDRFIRRPEKKILDRGRGRRTETYARRPGFNWFRYLACLFGMQHTPFGRVRFLCKEARFQLV